MLQTSVFLVSQKSIFIQVLFQNFISVITVRTLLKDNATVSWQEQITSCFISRCLISFHLPQSLPITLPLLASHSIQLSSSIDWCCLSGHTAYISLVCFKFLSFIYPICSDSVLRENSVQEDEIGHEAMIIWWPKSNSWNCKHACSGKQRVSGMEQQSKQDRSVMRRSWES